MLSFDALTREDFDFAPGMAHAEERSQTVVRLFEMTKPDRKKTAETKVPSFKEELYIEMFAPGDRHSKVVRPVRLREKYPEQPHICDDMRFPKAFEAWRKDKASEGVVGTPLKAAPFLSPSQAEELRHGPAKLRTVEQLAAIADVHIGVLGMGGMQLRDTAKEWLQAQREQSQANQLKAQKEEVESKLAAMQQLLEEQRAQNAQLMKLFTQLNPVAAAEVMQQQIAPTAEPAALKPIVEHVTPTKRK